MISLRRLFNTIIDYHVGSDNAISSIELAKVFNTSPANIQHAIKEIRESNMPTYNYQIKSNNKGYYAAYGQEKQTHSANVKQWIGLTRSLMKTGEYSKGFFYQILNDLESEHLLKGQSDVNGKIYEKER